MTVFSTFRAAVQKRAEYRRTKREIEMLPPEIARDLGISRSDAARLASEAVYG